MMDTKVPPQLKEEQRALEAEIRAAFRGVTRDGGTSWRQAELDDYGVDHDDKYAAAGAADNEASWEELVDNPDWREEPGIGGFSFLDAQGYRYYIAPAMIRGLRSGCPDEHPIELPMWHDEIPKLLTKPQLAATARYVRFGMDVYKSWEDDISEPPWREAYDKFWHQWDERGFLTAKSET